MDRPVWKFSSFVVFVQYVFVSFLYRDNTYKVLMSICPHLEVGLTPPPCSYKRVLERILFLASQRFCVFVTSALNWGNVWLWECVLGEESMQQPDSLLSWQQLPGSEVTSLQSGRLDSGSPQQQTDSWGRLILGLCVSEEVSRWFWWPGWSTQTEKAGAGGEQQLWLPNPRLWEDSRYHPKATKETMIPTIHLNSPKGLRTPPAFSGLFCLLNPAEFPIPPFLDVVKHKTSPESPERQHKVKKKNKQSSEKQHIGRDKTERIRQYSWAQGLKITYSNQREVHKYLIYFLFSGPQQLLDRSMKTVSVNTVLFVYLFL